MRSFLFTLLAVAVGCSEFETPAELYKPQIVALRADPPVVAPGQSTALTALVAGPSGVMTPPVSWHVPSAAAIIEDGDEASPRLVVPDGASAGIIELVATVDAGGDSLVGVRAIEIVETGRVNPSIIELRVGQTLSEPGEPIAVPVDGEIELDVRVAPEAPEGSSVSWYANVGTIDLYRRAPTSLRAPDSPGAGTLIVVYRDGRGGVAWQTRTLSVE